MPIPESRNGLIPESKAVVEKIRNTFDIDHDVGLSQTDYGHALSNLARGIQAGEEVFDARRQKQHLRDSVLEILTRFGSKIIPLLREELRSVLTEEEIAQYEK